MKRIIPALSLLLMVFQGFGQLLSWAPLFPTENTSSFTITMDGSKGNRELNFYTPASEVYVHLGAITTKSSGASDWKYVKFTWGTNDVNARSVFLGNNKWSFEITGGIRAYFGINDPTERILKIAILFRSLHGNKVQRNADGSDMYIPVYASDLEIKIAEPPYEPRFVPVPESLTKKIGDNIAITAHSNQTGRLTLFYNGLQIHTQNDATVISTNHVINETGEQQIVAEIFNGSLTKSDTFNFFITPPVSEVPRPAGLQEGINYSADKSSVTMVLFAPGKSRVCIIGDFPGSDWSERAIYQLNKDGDYWWITLTGLTPGMEYGYQYLIDGSLKIADPYAEKILDPWNDSYISPSIYPHLKPYPADKTTGIVSVFQPGKAPYIWKNNAFEKPDKRSLIIYELLLRDFIEDHNWNTLRDTLNYLKKLGINAIQIMPLNEFEGNESWGYNPSFYFAPDKYYGPANSLKELIDSCHSNGIAVIMDIALNHSFGQSPMVQMYWDAARNRPAADNPWFNPVPRHAYNVGFDFNHDKTTTRNFVDRVIAHWLQEYKIDGFRWDLSKGFTQKQTCDNNGLNCDVAAWSAYDAARVALWKRYYDTMQVKAAGAYCILEHFADNTEEKELSDYGMMLWGNANYSFNQATMGYTTGSGFDDGFARVRGWSDPHLITYMESHDEERLMVRNLHYGNSSDTYTIKEKSTALKRMQLATAFFLAIPGPKMIWQFGELGYDYSINHCSNGAIHPDCRTGNKPIRWDYLQDSNRQKLFEVYNKMIRLRAHPLFKSAFISNESEQSLSGVFKWIKLTGASGKLLVVGNFDVVEQTNSLTFPEAGTWIDLINGGTFNASGASQMVTLQPGEFFVYTNVPDILPVTLQRFEGHRAGDHNLLTWEVEEELNFSHYTLQKSSDGNNFWDIITIRASGSSSYSYADYLTLPYSQVYFYRLMMSDVNGQSLFSRIIKIENPAGKWIVSVRPNPVSDYIRLGIESPVNTKAQVRLTDLAGKSLFKQEIFIKKGFNLVELDKTGNLSAGNYLLEVVSKNFNKTLKILKTF